MKSLTIIHTERGDVDLLDTARESGLTIDHLLKVKVNPPTITSREQAKDAIIRAFGQAAWDKMDMPS